MSTNLESRAKPGVNKSMFTAVTSRHVGDRRGGIFREAERFVSGPQGKRDHPMLSHTWGI